MLCGNPGGMRWGPSFPRSDSRFSAGGCRSPLASCPLLARGTWKQGRATPGLHHIKPWGLFLVHQGSENPFQVLRWLLRKSREATPVLTLLTGGREYGAGALLGG